MFSFVIKKGGCTFRTFYVNRQFIPNCWRSYGESTFSNIQPSFKNNICFETNNLRVLDISEQYSRFAKCVGF